MNYTILHNYTQIDKQAWTDFVFQHPNGNVFQTVEMYELYEKTPNYTPVVFVSYSDENELVGVLLAVIHKEHKGMIGKFTARSIIIGGPLIKNNEPTIALDLLNNYNAFISNKAIYSQFRNLYDLTSLRDIFEKTQYVFEEHLNILIDLKKSEEELWKDVYSKRRNEIRKAQKEELTVKEVNIANEREEAYKILKEVYQRAKLPLASKELFDNAFSILHPKQMFKIYGAYFQNNLVGTMFLLSYNGVLYDWYAGSYSAYYKKKPNDIIPWKIFLFGKESGYHTFDFLGAGKPNVPYGVRDYKMKFGGEFVNYGRFLNVHNQLLYSLGKILLKIYKLIKNVI